MTTPVLTFFNNKGGLGKTTIVYHLAWMFARLEKRAVIFDLDPQSNLTAAFLDEDEIETAWNEQHGGSSVYKCVSSLADAGDIAEPVLKNITANLYFLPGDIRLSSYESILSGAWSNSMLDNNLCPYMRILSSFWQIMQMASDQIQADIILVDTGPNLGAINRSVLLSTDYVVIPMGTDLISLQGITSLGPTLRKWKYLWQIRLDKWAESGEASSDKDFLLPKGKMQPIGYLCRQPSLRLERPIKILDKWTKRIPEIYHEFVLHENLSNNGQLHKNHCLATIKYYPSLLPMAQEHRKPIFNLTSADGAIGAHAEAVQDAKKDFLQLATKITSQLADPAYWENFADF
ncbi:MAG: AAA family ATPase [Bacteroidetes bacterium]|nr:AAA family ATPase [Bacteroidota bacterium]MCY4205845.1 AAA family ATPase [Bacteroidota bacterium]